MYIKFENGQYNFYMKKSDDKRHSPTGIEAFRRKHNMKTAVPVTKSK